MAQHIEIAKVEILSNEIRCIEDSDLNCADLHRSIAGYENEFPILSGIDEYGETFFNSIQVSKLHEELKRLCARDPAVEPLANQVIGFLQTVESGEYIQFVGD
jgi:hypothetical protein